MFKSLAILVFIFCFQVNAQDMSKTETFESSYLDMPDGSSKYVGRCTTHEDYKNVYFKSKNVFQKYVEIDSLTDLQIKNMMARFDKAILVKVLKTLELYEVAGSGTSMGEIFKNYVDDFMGEVMTHESYPNTTFIRIGFGVGGGNGGYMVFSKTSQGIKLLSYTFDSELVYCDRSVWLSKK